MVFRCSPVFPNLFIYFDAFLFHGVSSWWIVCLIDIKLLSLLPLITEGSLCPCTTLLLIVFFFSSLFFQNLELLHIFLASPSAPALKQWALPRHISSSVWWAILRGKHPATTHSTCGWGWGKAGTKGWAREGPEGAKLKWSLYLQSQEDLVWCIVSAFLNFAFWVPHLPPWVLGLLTEPTVLQVGLSTLRRDYPSLTPALSCLPSPSLLLGAPLRRPAFISTGAIPIPVWIVVCPGIASNLFLSLYLLFS